MTRKVVFVDHNVNLPAYAGNQSSIEAAIARAAIRREFDTISSQYCINTFERALLKGGSDFEQQDAEDATAIVELVAELAEGRIYTDAEVREELGAAWMMIRNADYSALNSDDRPDEEDARVLATALAAAKATGEYVSIVTNDKALCCVATSAFKRGVAIMPAVRFANSMNIRVASRAA